MNDIGVLSVQFSDYDQEYPFTICNTFDDLPMVILFNEICSSFFEVNHALRIKRGYEKFKIDKFGSVIKKLITKLNPTYLAKNKNMDDFILD